jgi:hypothetical protein
MAGKNSLLEDLYTGGGGFDADRFVARFRGAIAHFEPIAGRRIARPITGVRGTIYSLSV